MLKSSARPPQIPPLLFLGLLLLIVQLACSLTEAATPTVSPAGATPTREPTRPPATPVPSATATVGIVEIEAKIEPPPSADPGMACFGSGGEGVTCLDEDGWHAYTQASSPLRSDYVQGLTVCPNGAFAIATLDSISLFDGQDWRTFDGDWGHASPEAVACSPDGRFWVAHFRGVSVFAESQWTTYPSSDLATADDATDLVEDVAVNANLVWVVTPSSIARWNGQHWTRFQEGEGLDRRYFMDAIALDARGRPWVAHSNGLLVYENSGWVDYSNRELGTPTQLAVDLAGRVWVGTISHGLFCFDDGVWTEYSLATGELTSDHVRSLTIDGRNRIWVGTPYGLSILDGDTWHVYQMANSDLLDHDIRALAVIDGGPTLPEPAVKEAGGLSGRFVGPNNAPLANATVEVCVESLRSQFFGETPCEGQGFIRQLQTDEQGRFAQLGLPPGFYVLAIETGTGWVRLTGDYGLISERVRVSPGLETELGTLVMDTN